MTQASSPAECEVAEAPATTAQQRKNIKQLRILNIGAGRGGAVVGRQGRGTGRRRGSNEGKSSPAKSKLSTQKNKVTAVQANAIKGVSHHQTRCGAVRGAVTHGSGQQTDKPVESEDVENVRNRCDKFVAELAHRLAQAWKELCYTEPPALPECSSALMPIYSSRSANLTCLLSL